MTGMAFRSMVLVVFGLLVAKNADAGQCVDYADYGYWLSSFAVPRPVTAVAVEESKPHLAYFTFNDFEPGRGAIGVLDITNPSAPAMLDTLIIPGTPNKVAVQSGIAWIAAGAAGLIAVDVRSPTDLQLVGAHPTPGEAVDVAIRNSMAYVAAWDSGMEIFDIASPAAPRRVGGLDLPGFAVALDVTSTHAYIADLIGIVVIDITTPETPRIVSSLQLSKKSSDVAVRSDRAYVPCRFDGVQIIDVSDPENLLLVGEIRPENQYAWSIEVFGKRAYLMGSGLTITSLEDDPPVLAQFSLDINDGGGAVAAVGDLIIAGQDSGVDILEFSPPAPVTGRATGGGFGWLAVDGNLACAVANGSRMRVVDMSDPSAPLIRGSISIEAEFSFDMTMNNTFSYLWFDTIETQGVQVIDLAKPDAPTQAGEVILNHGVSDMVADGDYLYVAGRFEGLSVIDVSDPTDPFVCGSLKLPVALYGIDVAGTLACVMASSFELSDRVLLIDIADPQAPSIAGSYALSEKGSGVLAAEGNHAYVLERSYSGTVTMSVIDISDAKNPVRSGFVALPTGETRDIHVSGHTVYIAQTYGMLVVDVQNPSAPVVVGGHSGVIHPIGLGVSEQHVVATIGSELLVLPLQCQEPQAVELAAFDAVAEPGAIRISWRTSREEDHLGFQVERAMAEVGPFLRIHRHLIEPPGPYTHRDPDVRAGDTYYYRLAALDRFGGIEHFGPLAATAIAGDATALAPATTLARSQPNPFTPATTHTSIRFTIAHPGPATLRLYDPAGRLIQTLIDGPLSAGEHLAKWDGRNTRGEPAAAGTYFYKLTAGDFTATRALVRLR